MTPASIVTIFVLAIVGLLLHHYLKHGTFFENHDGLNAVWNLAKSHEGIIIAVLLLLTGVILVA